MYAAYQSGPILVVFDLIRRYEYRSAFIFNY
jgi:hypothetical protein